MRCGTQKVRFLHRCQVHSQQQLARYKFDLVGVQEVRWEGGAVRAGDFIYSVEKETTIIN
jgi:hypothetical protein